jgi:hypothetical protein
MRCGDEEQRVVRAHGTAAFDATRRNDSAVTHKGKPQDSARNKDNNNILVVTTATTPSAFFCPVQHEQMLFIIL